MRRTSPPKILTFLAVTFIWGMEGVVAVSRCSQFDPSAADNCHSIYTQARMFNPEDNYTSHQAKQHMCRAWKWSRHCFLNLLISCTENKAAFAQYESVYNKLGIYDSACPVHPPNAVSHNGSPLCDQDQRFIKEAGACMAPLNDRFIKQALYQFYYEACKSVREFIECYEAASHRHHKVCPETGSTLILSPYFPQFLKDIHTFVLGHCKGKNTENHVLADTNMSSQQGPISLAKFLLLFLCQFIIIREMYS